MRYTSYLVHFNPNHDPKSGRFTFNKYQNADGTLSKYARAQYGLDRLDPNNKNFNPRKAEKAFKKELKENGKIFNTAHRNARYFFEDLAEEDADRRLQEDIDNGNKNKSLVKDVIDLARKYIEIEDRDGWSDAYEYHEKSRKELEKKYPQFKEMLSNLNIGESVNKHSFNEWAKSNKPFPDALNNDTYYEPDYEAVPLSSIFKQVNSEYAKYYLNKYGDKVVPKEWKNL